MSWIGKTLCIQNQWLHCISTFHVKWCISKWCIFELKSVCFESNAIWFKCKYEWTNSLVPMTCENVSLVMMTDCLEAIDVTLNTKIYIIYNSFRKRCGTILCIFFSLLLLFIYFRWHFSPGLLLCSSSLDCISICLIQRKNLINQIRLIIYH